MGVDAIPAALVDCVVAECGPIDRVEDRSWDHGEATVLRVAGPRGAVFVKRHRTDDHHRREVAAYENWVAGWEMVPRFLGYCDEPKGLAVTAVPGISVLDVPVADRGEAHRQAGAFLARLHALPVDDDDAIALDEAIAMRTESWGARAEGRLDPSEIDWVRAEIDAVLPHFAQWGRRACHRDFTERNWLLDGERLWVFDFGISRLDTALTDIERIWSSSWREAPELADAFWEGYGRRLTAEEEAALVAYGALAALTTVVWAVDHDDAPFEANGRERLAWLRSGA